MGKLQYCKMILAVLASYCKMLWVGIYPFPPAVWASYCKMILAVLAVTRIARCYERVYSYCHLMYGQVIARFYELVYSISFGTWYMCKLLQVSKWLLPPAAWASYYNIFWAGKYLLPCLLQGQAISICFWQPFSYCHLLLLQNIVIGYITTTTFSMANLCKLLCAGLQLLPPTVLSCCCKMLWLVYSNWHLLYRQAILQDVMWSHILGKLIIGYCKMLWMDWTATE